jgi:hypothetical protein
LLLLLLFLLSWLLDPRWLDPLFPFSSNDLAINSFFVFSLISITSKRKEIRDEVKRNALAREFQQNKKGGGHSVEGNSCQNPSSSRSSSSYRMLFRSTTGPLVISFRDVSSYLSVLLFVRPFCDDDDDDDIFLFFSI